MRKILFGISTRRKILFSVSFLTVLFVILQQFTLFSNTNSDGFSRGVIQPIILFGVTFILMYWVVNFRINGERFITILGFPSVGVFVFSIFVDLIVNTIFGSIGAISFIIFSSIIFFLFTYITFLTANVLNLSYLEDIPLGQAGRASYYVIILIISYLVIFMIVSNDINLIAKLLLIFFSILTGVTSSLWTIKESFNRRISIASVIAFLETISFVVLSMWPIDATYISFILLLFLYITLGLALEVRERINNMVLIEYTSLLIMVLIILVLISEWGINGRLI